MKRIVTTVLLSMILVSSLWAAKIEFQYPSGSTIYAVIRKPADATVWNGSTWETWADPNIGIYDILLADGSGKYYSVDFPVGITAGTYTVGVYLQAAGAPAVGDTLLGADSMAADGVPKVDVIQWNGTAVASPDTAGYPIVTIKDGTGTGEIDTSSGTVALRAATQASIDAIETDTSAYDTDAEHAAAIWNALKASYGVAGSYGEAVEAIPTVADIWGEALPGAYAVGEAGAMLWNIYTVLGIFP